MLNLYRKIWRLTGRAQIVLIVLPMMVAALAVLYLQYQKDIINGLIENIDRHDLLLMGAQFLGVIILSGGLKFALGYRSSTLGESVIRELRNQIFRKDTGQQTPKADRTIERGTLATMISAEAEEVGKFAGSAVATPLMQIGILVSVVAFIASTQPLLGAFVIGVVLVQAMIVLSVQKSINLRIAERVGALRRTTNRIVTADLNGVEHSVLADFDEIYESRRGIFLLKQSSKFALNAINGVGTAGILMLGGWLVLDGRTDIGTVAADLAGFARIAQPWREFISFFRSLSGARVKYELLKVAMPI